MSAIIYPIALADIIANVLDGDYNDLLEAHISASLGSQSNTATADITLTDNDGQDHHFTVTVTAKEDETR